MKTEGSVYAFAPSLSTLRRLTHGRLDGEIPPIRHEGVPNTQAGSRPEQTTQALPIDEVLPWPDVEGRLWTFSDNTIRLVGTDAAELDQLTTGTTDDHSGLVIRTVGDLSAWPALEGVAGIDAIWPVPDAQSVDGESFYWLFHSADGTQVYRMISVVVGKPHTSRRHGGDRPLSRWNSLGGVTHVDAVLPVPDQSHVDGKNQYWVFHTTAQVQCYRLVSVADGPMHTDAMVRGDRDLSQWESLKGVTKADAFRFVPGKYRTNGQAWAWAFHDRQYRVISIADGPGHTDTLIREDRPTTVWFHQP